MLPAKPLTVILSARAVGLAMAGLLVLAAAAGAKVIYWEEPAVLTGIWKLQSGDRAGFAEPGWDDSGWDSLEFTGGLPTKAFSRDSVGWFRKRVDLPPAPHPGMRLALRHASTTPQEFYWDGRLIGKTGVVAARIEDERIGQDFLTEIPAEGLAPGRHTLAIRMSAHHRGFYPTLLHAKIGDPVVMELAGFGEAMVMYFLAGVFVFGAIYRFLNYRAFGYGRNTFFFSLFVLACSLYIATQYLDLFVDLSYTEYMWVRLLLAVSWYGVMGLIPDYFIFAEKFPFRWLLPAVLIGAFLVAVPWGFMLLGYADLQYAGVIYLANQIFTYFSLAACIWVIAWAVLHRQTGSGTALAGILILLGGVSLTWGFDLYWGWAVGVAGHIVCLARAQSLQMAEKIRIHREAELRSARLEIELLKKNIQPHFLLNSLNSIIAWLEEDPKTATRLVDALAEELSLLLRVSPEQTIPVEQEIHLCRTHLQVMGLRQDKSFHFEVEGEAGEQRLPPLVLHTLVENGLTHGYAGRREGRFTLRRHPVEGGQRYRLFNDGTPKPAKEKKGDGTGLRYVRSRLEEAFPGRWHLRSGPVEDGWEVVLDIRD